MTEAERVPVALGVNVTLIEQFPPAATETLQVLVETKSPELAPNKEMLLMVKVALPVLFTVTDWGALVLPRF